MLAMLQKDVRDDKGNVLAQRGDIVALNAEELRSWRHDHGVRYITVLIHIGDVIGDPNDTE